MKFADLHLHTNYSDGTFTPVEVIAMAKKAGLDCISVCDHDNIDSRPQLLASGGGIEILPGIELSAEYQNSEVHILGYLYDLFLPWFGERLKEIAQAREHRMAKMCQKLNTLGMKVALEDILALAGHNCVGRLHLARFLVIKGYVSNIQEAFYKYIGDNCQAYVSGFKLNPKEAIDLILKAKGLPVLAHPHTLSNQEFIAQLAGWGIRGIEAFYPEHNPKQTDLYMGLARDYGLLVTGGSDCHGLGKPEIKIGSIKLPYEYVERLKDAKPK